MWFGVAPPSPSRVSRKDTHPPLCTCALHRLEREKRLEAERHGQPSPRRAVHQPHQPSTSGHLSSRQRGIHHNEKAMATPRRQIQRPREGTRGEERVRDKDQPSTKEQQGIKSQHARPEHGDEQSTQGQTEGELLLQLMEGYKLETVCVNGEGGEHSQQPQNPVQGSTKMSEVRFPGTSNSGIHRPRTGHKMSVVAENQADAGTLSVTPQLTSRSRRPSLHRTTHSPRADVDSLEGSNNLSSEWSTVPAPIVSLRPEHLVGHVASVCALIAHDDRFIISCSVDGSVKVWSQVTFECLHTLYGHRDVVSCIGLNSRWLASGSHDNTLRLYDCTTSAFSLLHVLTGHSGHVTQVRMPPTLPTYVISCSDDYTLRLWNAEVGQCIYELRAHHSRVTCFDVQPDHLCSGAADGSVCFWDLSSLIFNPEHVSDHHVTCSRIYYAHKATVQCIVDMSSGNSAATVAPGRTNSELCSVVVTGSNDGTIQLFSAKTFAHLGRLDNVGSPVYAAAALSNGRLLCSTKDGRLFLYGNLYRPTARKAPAVLQLATKWISSLQVCEDLVACSSEEVLYVVDTSRMYMALVFETQHSFITCTRWIHKGALITAGQDNIIKLWTIG